ncbi:MAG: HAMP domain-containing histidine kinase [Holosporales bacterium]|nr:HAMP domain-containing histidine kinase [Holosporales bacterium]
MVKRNENPQELIQRLQKAKERLTRKVAKMQHASERKDTYISSMTHELRTPLNAIIGYSEMLQEEVTESGNLDWSEDVRKIHVAGVHLLGVVNNILDLSKIEAGKTSIFVEPFDINVMLDDIKDIASTLMEKKSNTFVMDVPAKLGTMVSDLTKVRQSLLNFLSNAAKFTENGTITLCCRRSQDKEWVHFDVKDNGIGMTPGQIKLLFRPFQQAEASTSKKFGGTGLGLTITKKFCEILGGGVSVQSESGKGSTFAIKLPAETQGTDTAQAS